MILFCPFCNEKNCFEIVNFMIDLKNKENLNENEIYVQFKCKKKK